MLKTSATPASQKSATPAKHSVDVLAKDGSASFPLRVITSSRRTMEIQEKFFSGHEIQGDRNLFEQVAEYIQDLPKAEIEQATDDDELGFILFLHEAWKKTNSCNADHETANFEAACAFSIGNAIKSSIDEKGQRRILDFSGLPTLSPDSEDETPPPSPKHDGLDRANTDNEPMVQEGIDQQHPTSCTEPSYIENKGYVTEHLLVEPIQLRKRQRRRVQLREELPVRDILAELWTNSER